MKMTMKRLFSMLLVLCLMLSILPVNAFANGTEDGQTVVQPVEGAKTENPEDSETSVTPEIPAEEPAAGDDGEENSETPENVEPETPAEEPAAEDGTEEKSETPAEEEPETPEEEPEGNAEEGDAVTALFNTLMAFETYEALSDYMDNMTEEQYVLLDQFSEEQNAALTAKVTELQENDVELYPEGDHTFTHLDVRIAGVQLSLTKKTINLVTGATVSTSTSTITANLSKVEYVTINDVTYDSFYKMDAREWRQSNVKINLSALTDASTAVLVVDLVDSDNNVYNDVRITYNRAGIQYAMEHCDGYKNGRYDGIDFDLAQGTTNITLIEYDNYVIPVMKIWDDADNQDGKRPASVTVNLYADGTKVDSAVLNEDNNWEHTFTNKASHDDDGNKITYTINEDTVAEPYKMTAIGNNGTHLTVTNSYVPETTEITVTKKWEDANDQDGIRPGSITVKLLANGIEAGTATISGNGSHTFENLPKYSNGNLIEYTVAEVKVPEGYESSVAGNAEAGFVVTNTHIPATVSVSGSKTWNDADDQDGLRPDSIIIRLLADGTEVASKTVTATDGWAWSFTDLDKYAGGKEIKYTITEDEVSGYTSEVSGYNVTNTHVPETIDIEGTKTWVDADNQDGKRPKSITIRLLKNGTEVASKTVTAADGWAWSFTGMAKYADGKKIAYTITEDAVTDYSSSVNEYDVTNTHTPDKTSVRVTKQWNDNDDQDGIRPNDITVSLLADGKDTGKTLILSSGNDWTDSFTELDVYKEGKKIVYTVDEVAVADYNSVISGDASKGYTITNTHVPEVVEVSGSKTWDDNDNQDGKRPTSITINLLKNNAVIDTIEVTEEQNWSWKWSNLPKYSDGQEITYSIAEVLKEGSLYSVAVDGYNVTNSYTPEEISVSVRKLWTDKDNQDGIRPEKVTVNLLANGVIEETVELNEGNQWSYTFADLDRYVDGEQINYTVEEIEVAGYETKITGTVAEGFTIENVHVPEVIEQISGTKFWHDDNNRDGKRPDAITVNLLANGKEVASAEVSEATDWTYTFENLPKYEAGNEIEYSVTEDGVDDYETEYVKDSFDIINSYAPEMRSFTVSKHWVDGNDADGIRPDSVTIYLYANDKKVVEVELSEDNGWKCVFTVPKYENGEEIEYTIKEKSVRGYNCTITGNPEKDFKVTNTHNVIPKTGDESNLPKYIGLFGASASVMAVLMFLAKPKKGKYAR